MKRLLISITVLGTVLFSACEKNEMAMPAEKSLIKVDKGVLCRGCGSWDIVQPDALTETTTLRVTSTTDTASTKVNPSTTRRKK